jgi:hypothetical protein
MKRKDGKMIHIRKSSRAELFHKETGCCPNPILITTPAISETEYF